MTNAGNEQRVWNVHSNPHTQKKKSNTLPKLDIEKCVLANNVAVEIK